MSEALERVIAEVRSLTPEERQQLLDALRAEESPRITSRKEVVDRVHGKYASVRTSSAEFCERKREEIDREQPRLHQ